MSMFEDFAAVVVKALRESTDYAVRAASSGAYQSDVGTTVVTAASTQFARFDHYTRFSSRVVLTLNTIGQDDPSTLRLNSEVAETILTTKRFGDYYADKATPLTDPQIIGTASTPNGYSQVYSQLEVIFSKSKENINVH